MRNLRQYASTPLLILGLFAFRSSFADQYVIPSGSMQPAIQIGDHVLVNKMAYDLKVPFTDTVIARLREPTRGQIVVFRDPRDPSVTLIKRLIALPGDRVHVRDGFVEVNGQALTAATPGPHADFLAASAAAKYTEHSGEKTYVVQRTPRAPVRGDQEWVVPPDQYFFLGDNRDNSADSRVWGFAPRANLKGHALRVLYSFAGNRFGVPL